MHTVTLSILVDHTRVVLKDGDPEVPGSDYINANYISVNSLLVSRFFLLLFTEENFLSFLAPFVLQG